MLQLAFVFLTVFLLVCLLLTLIIGIKVEININRTKGKNNTEIKVYIIKDFFEFRYDLKEIKLGRRRIFVKKTGTGEDRVSVRLRDIISKYEELKEPSKEAVAYLKNKIKTDKLKLIVVFGAGEAYYTAILTGMLWGAAGVFISFLENKASIKEKKVVIKPVFNENKLDIDLHCIFRTRIVHIIVVGIRFLTGYLSDKIKFKRMVGGDLNG